MMILFLVFINGFKSQYNIYYGYRKIPFCLWHIDVGLHTYISCLGGLPRDSVARLTGRARNDLKCVEGP